MSMGIVSQLLVSVGILCGGFAVLDSHQQAWAQEPADMPTAAPPPKKSVKRGKRAGEKETEGSQAPNRFEADPIIKSKYRLDGQPLEVDPD
jgi:hypothetical protein